MIDPRELSIGSWCCFLTGKDNDKLSMPMKVCCLYENEACLTFDENEADPWYCSPEELMPIKIDKAILEKNGWFYKNGYWTKKGPVRLSWHEKDATLIAGYWTVPCAVEFVHQIQTILRLLGLEDIEL